MKAAVFDAFGDADVMHLADVPKPEVRETDLLIHVRAAGVNRADLTQRRGGYGWPDFGDSTLMGLEIAGEVVTMGAKTRSFKLGDRVMGIVGGGGYGEFARIDYRMAMPIPPNLSYTLAAAVPEVFVTAHEALIHLGRLQAGDTVLIHAAAGGVGSAAVQLAHAQGARIFASADYNKLDRVQEFGADVGIDRNGQDFAEVIASKMANRGVDVIIDFIGAPYFERNLASLSHGGRLVQVGILGGALGAAIALETLLYRYLQIIGTVMKSRTKEEKRAMVGRFSDRWLDHFADGRLVPVLDSVFPLRQVAAAHRRMESGLSVGKIVLTNN